MKPLYPRTDGQNDQNALAPHFFFAGYHLRQLTATVAKGARSQKWRPHLNILRSELRALKAYAIEEQSKAHLAASSISAALEEAVQKGGGGQPKFADLRVVLIAGKSATRVEPFQADPSRSWFMVGITAADCDLLPKKVLYSAELREEDYVLLNFLGPIIRCGEAARLIQRAYSMKRTLQSAITDWLHAQTQTLWEPSEVTGKNHRFNGRDLTEIEYHIMEIARQEAYEPEEMKGLTSKDLEHYVGPSAPHALRKLRQYKETSGFLSVRNRKPLHFIAMAPMPPSRSAHQQNQ